MNIYSIEEIVNATNNLLDSNDKSELKKIIKISNENIPLSIENIIIEAESAQRINKNNQINFEAPLILKNEISDSNKVDSLNYKIKIKPDVKDHMIKELYIYLKKKIKKNTLKLIIENQVDIKNLKNKINFLKQKENNLKIDYNLSKKNYELSLENIEILKNINKDLLNNLDKESKINDQLFTENKELKNNNKNLLNNLDKESKINDQLSTEFKELKVNLNERKLRLEESIKKDRSFEINNAELKNTISRYIINNKKMQEKINLLESSKNLEFDERDQKVKFYQDENIRLSSELLLVRNKNETIKLNLNNIELEKQKISNKIKELSNTITGKSNIISSPIIKENPEDVQKDINNLNDKEQKSLDQVINRIFEKI